MFDESVEKVDENHEKFTATIAMQHLHVCRTNKDNKTCRNAPTSRDVLLLFGVFLKSGGRGQLRRVMGTAFAILAMFEEWWAAGSWEPQRRTSPDKLEAETK